MMENNYKSCRHKGKRMRKHRAILMMRLEGWGWSDDEIKDYMNITVVHHINGDKDDNRPSNLRYMSPTLHKKLHARKQKRNKNGRFV